MHPSTPDELEVRLRLPAALLEEVLACPEPSCQDEFVLLLPPDATVATLRDAVERELGLDGGGVALWWADAELRDNAAPLVECGVGGPWGCVDVREPRERRAACDLRARGVACTEAALIAAVKGNDRALAVNLLDAGVSVNCRSNRRYSSKTPLHIATERGYAELCGILLDRGADVRATDHYGDTPLHNSAASGSSEVAALLLSAYAPLDRRNVTKQTPLMLAVKGDNLEIASLLLAAGCDHTVHSSEGTRASHMARTREMYQLFPKKTVC